VKHSATIKVHHKLTQTNGNSTL